MTEGLGSEFCLVCGADPPLFGDRMCEPCIRKRIKLVEVPENIPWVRCARCGIVEIQGKWVHISEEEISIPPAEFESELSLPSGDFQKIIRDMINIGENIEIKSIGTQLVLNCEGDFAAQETLLGQGFFCTANLSQQEICLPSKPFPARYFSAQQAFPS